MIPNYEHQKIQAILLKHRRRAIFFNILLHIGFVLTSIFCGWVVDVLVVVSLDDTRYFSDYSTPRIVFEAIRKILHIPRTGMLTHSVVIPTVAAIVLAIGYADWFVKKRGKRNLPDMQKIEFLVDRFPDESAVKEVAKYIYSYETRRIRRMTIEVLGLAEPTGTDALVDFLSGEYSLSDLDDILLAARVLANIEDSRITDIIRQLLAHKDDMQENLISKIGEQQEKSKAKMNLKLHFQALQRILKSVETKRKVR